MADNAYVKPAAGRGDYVQPVPAWRVTLAGQDLTEVMRPRLIELSLRERRGEEADQLEITLHDVDRALALPPPEAIITVAMGWTKGTGVTVGLVDKGSFRVDEISWDGPPDALKITARAADLTAGLRTRRDRSWNDRTIGQIIGTIAGEHGLTARVHASLAGIAIPSIQQSARSDIQFVRDLGRRYDAVATVKNAFLLFMPIGLAASAGGTPLPSLALTRTACERYSWSRRKREEHQGAEAQWNDRAGARRQRVRVGQGDNPRRLRRTYASEAEARAAAEAAARRDARQAAQMNLALAFGEASIGVEQPIALTGFKAEIDAAPWQVAEVSHTIGANGFRTELSLDLGAQEEDQASG